MTGKYPDMGMTHRLRNTYSGQPSPPAGMLEERVMELESLGFADNADSPSEVSSLRQFVIASLMHTKPEYFVTTNHELLARREFLETRYGVTILSLPEALLLLRDWDGPPN